MDASGDGTFHMSEVPGRLAVGGVTLWDWAPALARHEGLAEVACDGRVTVLNLPDLERHQVPYVFEGTAFEIWVRIDGTRTEQALVQELAFEYGAPAVDIAGQVHGFLAQLVSLGLVVGGGFGSG